MIENKKKNKPIPIVYKPTKHPEIEPICHYSNNIAKAYTNFYLVKNKSKRVFSCFECYYCRNFFLRQERQKRHMKIVRECAK